MTLKVVVYCHCSIIRFPETFHALKLFPSRGPCGIHRISQFLLGEFLSRDVDGLEPLQLFTIGAAADVDLQLVIEDLFLLVLLKVVEIAEVEGEVAVDELADADGALLPVDDFEVRLIVAICVPANGVA